MSTCYYQLLIGNVKFEMTEHVPDWSGRSGQEAENVLRIPGRDLTHSRFSKESMLVSIVITPEGKPGTVLVP